MNGSSKRKAQNSIPKSPLTPPFAKGGCGGIFVIFLLTFAMPLSANPPPLPTFPPLEFHPPQPQRVVLDNGLVIFLLEDHELPLIRLYTVYRAGSQYDSPAKLGLSGIFGEVLSEGGSQSHTPEEIEKSLDRAAAEIQFSVSLENGGGSMRCRTADFDQIFGLFTDLFLHPQFRKDFVELSKVKSLEALRRMNDDPAEVARREFRGVIYGKDHPYARIPSPTTLDRIKRDDLLAMHTYYLHPNSTLIAVSGDFQSTAMIAKLKQAFGSWPRMEVTLPSVAPVNAASQRALYYIQRPINQSQIRIGHLGLERHNPDHFAWEVFNELWGGSGTSLLFRTVRTQQGLAYSVGSGFSEPAQKGLIVAVSQTRGSQTIAAVQSMLAITREASAAPFTPKEINEAKEAIRNRFIENYTSSAQIATEVMSNEYFGFPKDYLDTYTQKIAQVTGDDLRRAAKTYLHPDESTILIMGDLSTFEKPMSTLGKPQEIKLIDYAQEAP